MEIEPRPLEDQPGTDQVFLTSYRLHNRLWEKKTCDGWRIVIPPNFRTRLLFRYHDDDPMGHPGYVETYRNIATYYTWPCMKAQITAYVQNCLLCSCSKAYNWNHKPTQRPRRSTRPWETVCLDLMGPYPLSKRRNRFILVITDSFSRWIEAYLLPHGDANTIGRMMDMHLFPRWGYPKILLSDNGTQFTGKLWNKLCLKWGVLHYTTPIYHPRANPTKRRNQELKKGLRIRLQEHHQEWENQLPSVLFTLRNRQNTATRYSPSQILFGQTLPRPGEWSHWPENQLEPHKDHINQRLHMLTAIQREAVLNQENYLNRKGDTALLPDRRPGAHTESSTLKQGSEIPCGPSTQMEGTIYGRPQPRSCLLDHP
ncbi:protein NYNRIN-like [Nilaparvata lugens]|uniref:protein NYNRIN-like n=1 Tax=Nilaparvata lugens TaxID=108931 RepID=UPI00193D3884|nr:protein NYNRIN-like [Nilaparvata lugens]